ncbi:hypothetical protein [Pseudomarimonas salicorniae]|uniref:Sel1 repeat-containing protein n=1 Tax=Pseudomarimonas salicorniae TaxID=2933270 RepID=A0ABT0GLD5_9GAMM|nr:hypothetical protein [Lysobacter sp. CAU 1642]MCK7595315.1 hypothetical protein [Lysobacter sp. CAU 1642]
MGRALLLSILPWILYAPAMAASLLPRYSDSDLAVMETPVYLATHPDLRWRMRGLESLERGESAEAIEHLLQAAQHADKAAQALLAELYWTGRVTKAERVEGHAFMALAAERGYPRYAAFRDRYWDELGEAEQAAAVARHAQLLDTFGDAVAKPRMEAALQSSHARRDGSRTRSRSFARPFNGGMPGTGISAATGVDTRNWQDPKFWQPTEYWAWQDALYERLRPPRVKLIELRPFARTVLPTRGVLSETEPEPASE